MRVNSIVYGDRVITGWKAYAIVYGFLSLWVASGYTLHMAVCAACGCGCCG
jgi:hypothetical protein